MTTDGTSTAGTGTGPGAASDTPGSASDAPDAASETAPGAAPQGAPAPAPAPAPASTPAERRAAELFATDPEFAAAKPLDEVTDAIREPGIGLARIMETVMTGYADRPAFGVRARRLVRDAATGRTSDELLPEFRTTTYREVWEDIRALAAELTHHPESPVAAGDFVCSLGFTSADYARIDLACIYLGLVSVPLHAGNTYIELAPVVAESDPAVLVTNLEHLDVCVELTLAADSGAALRRIVVMDCDLRLDDDRERFEAAAARLAAGGSRGSRVALDAFADVIARGRDCPPVPLRTDDDPEALNTLLYTSGSTGTPKGAMYSQRLAAYLWGASWRKTDTPVITLNPLQMSHLSGRYMLFSTLSAGGVVNFTAKSNFSTLFEDLSLTRPTDVMLVPRISEMLHEHYRGEVERRVAAGTERAAAEAELLVEMRDGMLGGRIVRLMSGSAPLDAETAAFLQACLEVTPLIGYGCTEAGMITTGGRLAPPVIEHKLVDAPDLGYFTTDKPFPRGELRIKTEMIMGGYYKRPEATAAAFDEEGFYKTGDIMALTGEGEYTYVDRTANVFKLSQGEFVALSRLETLYAESPVINQIVLYGSSERAHLLAVVVPSDEALAESGGDTGRLKAAVTAAFRETARERGLKSYEIPRDFIVETEPFSVVNGLLSNAGKLARPRALERYGDRLEQLYADLAAEQAAELRELHTAGRDLPVLETVGRAVRTLIGTATSASPAEFDPATPGLDFTSLGGDSLAALSFSQLLGEIYGVEVPVPVVTSPAYDLRAVARYVEARLDGEGQDRPACATVHGLGATEVHADEIELEAFVGADTVSEAKGLPRPAPDAPVRSVLLTGANGYLGRFLCLEWLERLAEGSATEPEGGKLTCLVRARDDEEARRHLDAAYDSGDPELAARYRESTASGRLHVVAGDLSEPRLGLDGETWRRLADETDLILHAGALVNHVLPYDQLFGPNVNGTAELVRLALTARVKPVAYVSTVAVGSQSPREALTEDADIRTSVPTRRLDDSYASGYGTSKWASEILLREAHERCGLPVTVFRPSLVLAHSRYLGQVNLADLFTRLMLSIATTGLAPRSFYGAADRGPEGPRPRFGGIPVDYAARAIVRLAAGTAGTAGTAGAAGAADAAGAGGAAGTADPGYRTFNVVNSDPEGPTLDDFVDWMGAAMPASTALDTGRPVNRIDDYAEWYARFETSLRGQRERQRRSGVLALLPAFREPSREAASWDLPAERFTAAVRAEGLGAGPTGGIPPANSDLIRKYVADLRHLGLL